MGSLEEPLTHSASEPTQPTLSSLAAEITKLSDSLTCYLKEHNIPPPSLAADSSTSYSGLSPEIFMMRQVLLDKLMDMWYLTQGPSESIFNYVHCCMPDAAALNILNYFDFWSAVPLDGSASFENIAKHTSLPEEVVERVLQHAFTLRIFAAADGQGSKERQVQHTSRSAALAKSSGLRALVSTILDDAGAPMMVMNSALDKFSRGKPKLTQDMSESSFALLHSNGALGRRYVNSWALLENDGAGDKEGWRQKNFVEFMRYLKEIFNFEKVILDALDWGALGAAKVVDVGGSAGHDAIVLARQFPSLTLTVQDLPKVRSVFEAGLPKDLGSRVAFMEHDFFNPQPVEAEVYIFKMILHDWPDHEAQRILRALIPVLKPGVRVLLIEYMGSAGGDESAASLPRSIQQMGTATDLRLMALFNGKERPVGVWKGIFEAADERFQVADVKAEPGSFFAVIEAVWRG